MEEMKEKLKKLLVFTFLITYGGLIKTFFTLIVFMKGMIILLLLILFSYLLALFSKRYIDKRYVE